MVLDSNEHAGAFDEEIMAHLGAVQELSETITTAELEFPDSRSHSGILEAVAIRSRDVRGLPQAQWEKGPQVPALPGRHRAAPTFSSVTVRRWRSIGRSAFAMPRFRRFARYPFLPRAGDGSPPHSVERHWLIPNTGQSDE
ncbi:hypothetical protein [Tahibacter sp.]|uniref:hypothetical protein n=1 Tax=Tahibacter sp. TaxID=2056211 RepID=UPI0028C3BC1D|nr:hypothetical protein [Tahibacter sp.]